MRREREIERMIRVDHAGEYGARRIYDGQLAVLGPGHPLRGEIQHMSEQEIEHLETFDKIITERGVRPTALGPFWHGAGFALGAVTALMGEKAAMACTAAVEEVLDDHYKGQVDQLEDWDEEPGLRKTIRKFREDEIEHRNTAHAHGAAEAPGYGLLSSAIKSGCRAAIWLSKRI